MSPKPERPSRTFFSWPPLQVPTRVMRCNEPGEDQKATECSPTDHRVLPESFLGSYSDRPLLLSTSLPPPTLPNTFTGRQRRQPRKRLSKSCLSAFGNGRGCGKDGNYLEIGDNSGISERWEQDA